MVEYMNILIRVPYFLENAHNRLREFSAENFSSPEMGLILGVALFILAMAGIAYFAKR